MTKFEIQTYTLCDGWINTWTEENEQGQTVPVTFVTLEEAETGLQEYLKQSYEDYKDGNIEDCPSREEYCIAQINMTHTRGQIEKCIDMFGDAYYKIYTGCKHLDDFYTADDDITANRVSQELTNKE